jgi:hypothetical protein
LVHVFVGCSQINLLFNEYFKKILDYVIFTLISTPKKKNTLFLPLSIKNIGAIPLSLLMFSYIIEEIADAGENT